MPSSVSASRLQILTQTVEASTLTIAEASGTDLGRVVAMSANTSQARSLQNWNVELCKVADAQFSIRLTEGFDLPECLYVRKLISTLPSGSEMSAAIYWAFSSRLKVPPVYFEVGYAKYAPSGFLAVTVFLPNTFVRDEAAALAWGKYLVSSMQPLAEGTRPRAHLPGMQ